MVAKHKTNDSKTDRLLMLNVGFIVVIFLINLLLNALIMSALNFS